MIAHKRIRVLLGKVGEAPLKYTGLYSRLFGWTDHRVASLPPGSITESEVMLIPGATVPGIGRYHVSKNPGSWLFINGPFFNKATRHVLGRTIFNGKVVEPDVPGKTEKRPHLYCKDGKIDIGRVNDPSGVHWAVCGYTLVKQGKYVFPVPDERIASDVANGYNQRTLAGVKPDGTLILDVIDEGPKDKGAKQEQAARYLMALGCTKVIGFDGGGSSTLASNDNELQDVLDLKDGYHVCEVGSAPRATHHAIGFKLDKDVLFGRKKPEPPPKPKAVIFGIDCSQPITAKTAADLVKAGAKYAIRYYTKNKANWKRMSRAEAERICASGMMLGSVWETYAGRAAEGAAAGKEDGALALRDAREMGQPEGTVVFFAVDFDAQAKNYDGIEAYLRAAASVLTGYEVGGYGEFEVVEEMAKRGACKYFWQTIGWSGGKKSARADMFQYKIDTTLAGVSVDLNEAYTDEVFWTLPKGGV